MTTMKYGGQWTKAGTYLGITGGEWVTIPQGGGVLPGKREARYLRTPLPLLVVLGPAAGLVYIIFLPVVGILLVAQLAVRKVAAKIGAALATIGKKGVPKGVGGPRE